MVACVLVACIFAFGRISGAHFNCAVSAMMYMKGRIDAPSLLVYIIAQLLGAVAAVVWYDKYMQKSSARELNNSANG